MRKWFQLLICSWRIYRKTMIPQSLLSGLYVIISPFVIWYKYHRINRITVPYSTVQKYVDTRFSILSRIKSRIETRFSIVASRFSIPVRLINQNGLFVYNQLRGFLFLVICSWFSILDCCENLQPLFKFWASSNFSHVKKIFLLQKITNSTLHLILVTNSWTTCMQIIREQLTFAFARTARVALCVEILKNVRMAFCII